MQTTFAAAQSAYDHAMPPEDGPEVEVTAEHIAQAQDDLSFDPLLLTECFVDRNTKWKEDYGPISTLSPPPCAPYSPVCMKRR